MCIGNRKLLVDALLGGELCCYEFARWGVSRTKSSAESIIRRYASLMFVQISIVHRIIYFERLETRDDKVISYLRF